MMVKYKVEICNEDLEFMLVAGIDHRVLPVRWLRKCETRTNPRGFKEN